MSNNARLTITQGTPFSLLVRIKVRDNETGESVPLDLSSADIRFMVRKKVSSSVSVLSLSLGHGITLDAEDGVFIIEMTEEETAALVWSSPPNKRVRAVYTCEVEATPGDTFRAISGTITLDPEVVR